MRQAAAGEEINVVLLAPLPERLEGAPPDGVEIRHGRMQIRLDTEDVAAGFDHLDQIAHRRQPVGNVVMHIARDRENGRGAEVCRYCSEIRSISVNRTYIRPRFFP